MVSPLLSRHCGVFDSAIFVADFQNEGTCYVSAVRLPLPVPASPVSLAGRLAAVQAAGSGPAAERHQALEWAGGTGFPVPHTPGPGARHYGPGAPWAGGGQHRTRPPCSEYSRGARRPSSRRRPAATPRPVRWLGAAAMNDGRHDAVGERCEGLLAVFATPATAEGA